MLEPCPIFDDKSQSTMRKGAPLSCQEGAKTTLSALNTTLLLLFRECGTKVWPLKGLSGCDLDGALGDKIPSHRQWFSCQPWQIAKGAAGVLLASSDGGVIRFPDEQKPSHWLAICQENSPRLIGFALETRVVWSVEPEN